jgi:hypothetical protein
MKWRLLFAFLSFAAICWNSTEAQTFASQTVTLGPSDYVHVDNPPCHAERQDNVAELAGALAAGAFESTYPELKLASPLVGGAATQIVVQSEDWIRQQGGDIGKFLVPDRYATCATVAADLPANCPMVNLSVSMAESGGDFGACDLGWPGGGACRIGWSAYTWEVKSGSAGSFAAITLKNWSNDRTRRANVVLSCSQS